MLVRLKSDRVPISGYPDIRLIPHPAHSFPRKCTHLEIFRPPRVLLRSNGLQRNLSLKKGRGQISTFVVNFTPKNEEH